MLGCHGVYTPKLREACLPVHLVHVEPGVGVDVVAVCDALGKLSDDGGGAAEVLAHLREKAVRWLCLWEEHVDLSRLLAYDHAKPRIAAGVATIVAAASSSQRSA